MLHISFITDKNSDVEGWERWRSVVKDVLQITGDDFGIIYMDFVANVRDVEKCLKYGYDQNVKSYTGRGMSAADKSAVSKRFRYVFVV